MASGASSSVSSNPNAVPKPRLTFAQIVTMSFGFLGIQFGFALQNGNASRILQVFGADVEHLSWFWLVAPLTGMIVQPIIGHYSDKTWNKLGRRRPYFLTGAILAAVGLVLMPNAGLFTAILPTLWVGAGMLMIMDASFNVAMEPFRALIADKLPDEQRTLGYSVQTGLIGIGAVLGSWFPYILAKFFGLKDVAEEGKLPPNVIFSFVAGAVVLIITIIWTVATTKEYPPEEQRKYTGETEEVTHGKSGISQILTDFKRMPRTMRQLGLVQFFSWFALFSMWVFSTPGITRSKYNMTITGAEYSQLQQVVKTQDSLLQRGNSAMGTTASSFSEEQSKLKEAKDYFNHPKESFNQGGDKYFIESNLASYFLNKILPEKLLTETFYNNLKGNPATSAEYNKALTEIESLKKNYSDGNSKNDETMSYATFSYSVNTSGPAGMPNWAADKLPLMLSLKRVVQQYNEGANWVSGLFGIYNGVSAIFAFFLPLLALRLGRKLTHAISLICGGLGLLSIYLISDPNILIISMVGIGIAWASILSMPYVILSGSIPASKMGIYMGIFNFFITLPQIINGIFGGLIVKYFYGGKPILALVLAGFFMLAAAISVLFVYDAGAIRIKQQQKAFSEAELLGSGTGPAV